jgi:uncharacterized coiled-coil protein SlyX
MAKGILKGLAVAAGTGLAMGLTSGRVRVRSIAHHPDREPGPAHLSDSPAADSALEHDDEFLDIEPLLDRLERLEARVESIGITPAGGGNYAALLEGLERRVEENTRQLALLGQSITEAEHRLSQSVEAVEKRVAQTREEMPAFVQNHVAVRIADLQNRLNLEIEQTQRRTIETFERAIDEKISSRIGSMEKALAEQAGSIRTLSARTAETDSNLQRLVTAIEKLCERAQLIPPAAQSGTRLPVETQVPFESQLNEAMQRDTVVPVLRTEEPDAEVRVPAFAANHTAAPKKSRFLFRNLLAAGFAFLISRLLR